MNSDHFEQTPIIDHRFKVKSYEQYLKDLKVKKFNKVCMTEIINADMMIATFGEEQYYQSSAEILETGNVAYKQMGIDHLIHVYAYTYKNFMAVANDDMSDEDFLGLMKTSHEQYELATAQQTGLGGVSRFAVAFGDDLVNRVKSAYYLNKQLQNNFIVVTDEKERLEAETENNLRIFELLNYAIKNDKVVPYYQGVYDNEKGKISKYEALMRIFDKDGKIHAPGTFLEIAKKLKLYLPISKIMLDKAMKDFENTDQELSLNISLFDIQSVDFRNWFIKRVQQHPKPENITVEFVETENYNDNEGVFNFLGELKQLGCKIAVDDFGVGFATYTSIISLKPNIIKIDGAIIKNLGQDDQSKIIVDSICYMARLINCEIIAEFVEDADIQQEVVKNEIHFSQGYYFAKPKSFEDLEI